MQFPYGQFAPDAGESAPAVLMQADGVQPVPQGYGPVRSLLAPPNANAFPGEPRGIISMFLRDGTNVVYGFTATDAYELQADFTWSVAIGSGYSCPEVDDWSLIQFGNKLLASNTTDGLQQYDVELPAGFSLIDDAGAPRETFVCANTVVALDCLDNAGNRDNRLIRTSAIGNHTNWKKTGADYQPLEDGGRLVGGIDLKNSAGLIFQDNALRLIQFGTAGVGQFSITKISEGRGSVGRKSIVGLDGTAFWLSTDGFKAFVDGQIRHIGAGRIDQWFFDRVDQSNLSRVQGALDPLNKLVVWRYPTYSNAAIAVFDDMLGYSWQYDKWFTWTERTTYLSRISTPGITLDAMTGAWGTLDTISIPFYDRYWQGSQPVFAALNADYKYATFSGEHYAATFETGMSNSPVTGLVGWATPVDDADAGTIELGVKDALSDAATWKAAAAKVSAGRVPLRGRGMNIGFRRNIPFATEWTYATGIDHIVASTGGRK